MRKRLLPIVLAVAFVLLAIAPLFLSGYWIRVLTGVFTMAIVAQGINVVLGFAGYLAMGNVVFFGTGAYVTGVLMVRLDVPFIVSLAAAVLLCGLYAFILGLPILRLKGGYFTIATIGVNQATKEIITNLPFTGGGHGLGLPIILLEPEIVFGLFYYAFLGVMVLSTLLVWAIDRSRFGYALLAIRDGEEAAKVMGIDTTRNKVAAWSISAMLTGLAGGMYAYYISYLEPISVFDITFSVRSVIMTLLGGIGTVLGPILGAGTLEIVTELVWSRFLNFHLMATGLVIILAVRLLPKGLPSLFTRRKGGRA